MQPEDGLRGGNRLPRNLKSGIRLQRQTVRFAVVLPYAEFKPHRCANPVETRFFFNKHQLRYHPLTLRSSDPSPDTSVSIHTSSRVTPNHDSRAKSSILQSASLKQKIKNKISLFFLSSADFLYHFKCQKNLCFSTLTSSLLTDCCAHIHICPTPVSRLSGVIPFPEGAMKSCVKMLEVEQLKKKKKAKRKKKKKTAPMLIIFGPVSEVHSGPADGRQGAGVVRVGCCPWDPFASIQLSAGNILVYS